MFIRDPERRIHEDEGVAAIDAIADRMELQRRIDGPTPGPRDDRFDTGMVVDQR